MKKPILIVSALCVLGLVIYFGVKALNANKRDLAAPDSQLASSNVDPEATQNKFLKFQQKAQRANTLLVATDDKEKACAQDKMQLSAMSQQLRAELDDLTASLLDAPDFSAHLQNYITQCAQDCTCSVLSVFQTQIESDPIKTEKYAADLEQIKAALKLAETETPAQRKECVDKLGDLCDLLNQRAND